MKIYTLLGSVILLIVHIEAVPQEANERESICSLPLTDGPCLAHFTRFWYDASRQKCTKFVYGGCGGNANNFQSKDSCENKCGGFPSDPYLIHDFDTRVFIPKDTVVEPESSSIPSATLANRYGFVVTEDYYVPPSRRRLYRP